jgi:hypothetical protein
LYHSPLKRLIPFPQIRDAQFSKGLNDFSDTVKEKMSAAQIEGEMYQWDEP